MKRNVATRSLSWVLWLAAAMALTQCDPQTRGERSGSAVAVNALTATQRTMPVFIYSERNGRPDQILGTSSVAVQPGSPSVHAAHFPNPVRIQAGTTYWVAIEPSFPMILPIAQFGSPLEHALNNGGGWNRANTYSWNLRTFTTTGAPRRVPRLSAARPIIGTTMTIRLRDVRLAVGPEPSESPTLHTLYTRGGDSRVQ